MGKPEGIVENHLRKECKKRGYLCYKWVSPGQSGVPDDIVIGNSKTIYVECKSSVGHLSELQKLVCGRIAEQGCDVRIVYTKEDVDAVLAEIDSVKRWKKKEVVNFRDLRNTKKNIGDG